MTDLHHDAVVVDCHNDLILMVDRKYAHGEPKHFEEYWLPNLRDGGVDVQVIPVYAGDQPPEGMLRRILLLIETVHKLVERNEDDVALCTNGDEIDAAVSSGRIAFVIAMEGIDALGAHPQLVETMFRLGVRMMSYTHFGRTLMADGSAEDDTGSRLPKAGVAALGEMERLGIVTDVSHLSIGGIDHVLELATRPVIASHSSARTLVDHHRNLSDDHLRALAATGGVIGVNFFHGFVDPERATIDRLCDHVEHIASVAGADHVGIGPDFIKEWFDEMYAGYPDMSVEGLRLHGTVEGLETSRDLPKLTEALSRRGMSDADIRKVLGENFLRVFRRVMGRPRV